MAEQKRKDQGQTETKGKIVSKHRETLNDRYLVYTHRPTHEMTSWRHSPGWYTRSDKMKDDGNDYKDIGMTKKRGYTKPVLHWIDNGSIYVDHEP